ncbi:hypothetical protein [Belnapia moabensis]|uniref:hypothetical protein n=1 Tax=Belnapia moabensis TaxID=365533 RepID=UPI0012EE15CF|nr:hypothetical protein [Belnapia moabensis]
MADLEPDGGGIQWLSYDAIAALRGTGRDAAMRLVRRQRWPLRYEDDGEVRVAVPDPFCQGVAAKRRIRGQEHSHAAGQVGPEEQGAAEALPDGEEDRSAAVKALSEHIAALRQQLSVAQETAADQEEQLRHDLDTASTQLGKMQTELAAARLRAAAFQATLALDQRPFWRRWLR